MDVVVSRCAGIDIAKAEVVVCLRTPGLRGKRVSEVRTFSAVTAEITRLADWLAEHQVTHVVMEARPVLETGLGRVGRARLGADAGQCPPRQDGARPQIRRR